MAFLIFFSRKLFSEQDAQGLRNSLLIRLHSEWELSGYRRKPGQPRKNWTDVTNQDFISWKEAEQEAQLPQRDSASATHVFLGSLTDRALH